MRIVRVSYRVPPEPGGKERHVECLTREQLRRGHEVTLAFRGGSTVPNGAMVLPLRPTGLSCLLAVKSDVLAFAAEVVGALRNAGPVDLVHLHGDHVEASVIGPFCKAWHSTRFDGARSAREAASATGQNGPRPCRSVHRHRFTNG